MVIIGDNKNIVEVICCEIGIFRDGEDICDKSFMGCEFMEFFVECCKRIFSGIGGCVFLCVELKYK